MQERPYEALPAEWISAAPVATVVVGLLLLTVGRQLFWLLVALLGFFAAAYFASGFLGKEDAAQWTTICTVAGVAGALLALFVQKVAVTLAGALSGGYLAFALVAQVYSSPPEWMWIAVGLSAVVGAFLMVFLFRWALVLATSAIGAHLLLFTAPLPPLWRAVAYAAVFVTGVAWQSRSLRPKTAGA